MTQEPSSSTPSVPSNLPASHALGRFELRALLGRSDYSMAWHAFDPQHSREVTLMLPRVQLTDPQLLTQWKNGVLAASKLLHPQVAKMLDFGVESRWPYVSYCRSFGVTLSEWLVAHSRPTPEQAAGWMSDILSALSFAHDAGASHGDIEPFSVVLNEQGVVRLIGFGVPSFIPVSSATGQQQRSSSLVYQNPQQVAKLDVLAVGLLLQYLLSGQMPLGKTDVAAVSAKILAGGRESVRLPRSEMPQLPEPLHLILNQAISIQERQRYSNARTFRAALSGWLEKRASGIGGPMDVLRQRIKVAGYLPSGQAASQFVVKLQSSGRRHTGEIAEQILDDPGLTLEVLRQVNHARRIVGSSGPKEPVIKVRRAVALLGINGVKRCVESLRPWPGTLTLLAAEAFTREMGRYRLVGRLAQLLAPPGYDPEMLRLIAMMQNLGRFLLCYHFAEEAAQIYHLMLPERSLQPGQPDSPGLSEDSAALAVLGIELPALAHEVVKDWGLGEEMLNMMSRLPSSRVATAPASDADWLRIVASAANDVADISEFQRGSAIQPALNQVAQRYGKVLQFDAGDLISALRQAKEADAGVQWIKNRTFEPSMLMDLDDTSSESLE